MLAYYSMIVLGMLQTKPYFNKPMNSLKKSLTPSIMLDSNQRNIPVYNKEEVIIGTYWHTCI